MREIYSNVPEAYERFYSQIVVGLSKEVSRYTSTVLSCSSTAEKREAVHNAQVKIRGIVGRNKVHHIRISFNEGCNPKNNTGWSEANISYLLETTWQMLSKKMSLVELKSILGEHLIVDVIDDEKNKRDSITTAINRSTPYKVRAYETNNFQRTAEEVGDVILVHEHGNTKGHELVQRLRKSEIRTPIIAYMHKLDNNVVGEYVKSGVQVVISYNGFRGWIESLLLPSLDAIVTGLPIKKLSESQAKALHISLALRP